MHGIQVWAGIGASARENLAKGMEAIYKIPFENLRGIARMGRQKKLRSFCVATLSQGRA